MLSICFACFPPASENLLGHEDRADQVVRLPASRDEALRKRQVLDFEAFSSLTACNELVHSQKVFLHCPQANHALNSIVYLLRLEEEDEDWAMRQIDGVRFKLESLEGSSEAAEAR